jgi:hypothetical protein
MKNYLLRFYCILFFIVFPCCSGSELYCQKNVNISLGIGLPEFINSSVRYQIPERIQLGLSFGFMPFKEGNTTFYSASTYYHFGKLHELSNLRPWFTRISLDYLSDKEKAFNDKYLYADLRIGKEINMTKRIGIELNGGIMFDLIKQPSGSMFDMGIVPGFAISLVYHI